MSSGDRYNTSEDIFAETRMSFGEHIEDLRTHLVRAVLWLGFFVIISFFPFIGKNVLRFIAYPVEVELAKYWDKYYKDRSHNVQEKLAQGDSELASRNQPISFPLDIPRYQLDEAFDEYLKRRAGSNPALQKALGKHFGKPAANFDLLAAVEPTLNRLDLTDWLDHPEEWLGSSADANARSWVRFNARWPEPLSVMAKMSKNHQVVSRQPKLSTLSIQEAFMVYFKVCLMTGFILASPMIFYQAWSFVAAGLYPQEKRYVNLYLPFSIGLFILGVAVCQFLVIPKAVEALLWFNEWLGMEPDLRLNEWLGFAIMMPLVFGIAFQTPLVMLFMERMGIMKVENYRKARRIAWFVLTVFAAVIVPSPDILSVLFLLLPMCILYELGIWLCHWMPKRPVLDIEVPESEEMVEV